MDNLFTRCTVDRYYDQLGAVPPAHQDHYGFLVGEPMDHRICKVTGVVRPTYTAFLDLHGTPYESTEAITIPEYLRYSRAASKLHLDNEAQWKEIN